jgi:hypothetical protein
MERIRIDFPELGEGQYVEMRNPRVLSYGSQRKLASLGDFEELQTRMAIAGALATVLIVGGNVLDMDGNAVVFPVTETTVDDLPGEVVAAVLTKYSELKSGTDEKKF